MGKALPALTSLVVVPEISEWNAKSAKNWE